MESDLEETLGLMATDQGEVLVESDKERHRLTLIKERDRLPLI